MPRPANVYALPQRMGSGARDRLESALQRLSAASLNRNHGGAQIRGGATNRDQWLAGTAPAAGRDFYCAEAVWASPVPAKSHGNQGGCGRLFLCEELSV